MAHGGVERFIGGWLGEAGRKSVNKKRGRRPETNEERRDRIRRIRNKRRKK
jgi:hypothetical protein